jgi:phage terminase small subunit
MTLTARQARFVAEYLIDLNATQAAIRAGYSARSAYSQGERLLRHAEIRKAVAAGKKRQADRLELTAMRVLEDIHRIGTKAEKASDFGPALKARELLGKHLKLFTEKHEHGGIGGGPVVLQITPTDEDL